MHHFGIHLLSDEREAGLLPRQARRAVRDGGRARYDRRLWGEAAVALSVGTLTHDGQVGICLAEGGDQAIDVATDTPTVCWDRGGVDEHPGAHGSPHAVWFALPVPTVAR